MRFKAVQFRSNANVPIKDDSENIRPQERLKISETAAGHDNKTSSFITRKKKNYLFVKEFLSKTKELMTYTFGFLRFVLSPPPCESGKFQNLLQRLAGWQTVVTDHVDKSPVTSAQWAHESSDCHNVVPVDLEYFVCTQHPGKCQVSESSQHIGL